MKKTLKKKLCWNCEGNVTFQQENCPYCGVYLSPSDGEEDENSLLPPYHLAVSEEEASIPSTSYSSSEEKQPDGVNVEATKEISLSEIKALVIPLGLLLVGVSFGLFSLLLLLFSKNGYLTLSWDAELWYVYLIIAVPAFIFGYRFLQTRMENDP